MTRQGPGKDIARRINSGPSDVMRHGDFYSLTLKNEPYAILLELKIQCKHWQREMLSRMAPIGSRIIADKLTLEGIFSH